MKYKCIGIKVCVGQGVGGGGANINCPTAHNHFMCILPVKVQNVGQFVQLPAVAKTTHGQQLKQLPITALKHELSRSIATQTPCL